MRNHWLFRLLIVFCGFHFNRSELTDEYDDEVSIILTEDNTIIDEVNHGTYESDGCITNPDEYLTASQIIRRYGYASESHVLETRDGYLLTLHRIPVNSNGKLGKQPIFLQHGLLGSSADFLLNGNKSLAFILSDLGYDVWLGNARGNTYSKAHVTLLPNSAQFWNFSFHEMGVIDLPASLSYISNITNTKGELIYIGHSMGTTIFYVLASTFPQFTRNTVKVMVGLGPVAYMTHLKSPLRYLAPFVNDFQWLAHNLGIKEFLPNGKLMELLSLDCRLLNTKKEICEQIIFALCGFDKDQLEEELLPVILGHDPAGSSTKTIIHFAQEIYYGGNFMQFDYGTNGNLIQYGTPTPPSYNLSNIAVPTYFMYADNDSVVSPIDVRRLARKVSKNIGLYEVPLKTFNHLDFLWAKDVPELVYKNLTATIAKYALNE